MPLPPSPRPAHWRAALIVAAAAYSAHGLSMDASRSKPSQPSPRTLAPSPATQGRRGFCGGAAALSFAAAVPARAVPPIDCNSFGCAPAVQRGAGTPPAPVTTVSSPRALRVAAALEKKGIALYGAYWCIFSISRFDRAPPDGGLCRGSQPPQNARCGYCEKQRNVLGAKAAAMVTYVECDRDGRGFAGAPACAGVQAYPTWAGPDGQRVEGKLSLAQLEQLAGIETRPADAAADAKAAAAPAPVRNAKAPIVQGPSSAQASLLPRSHLSSLPRPFFAIGAF
ncbi:hypothetical protein M885DRAFT_173013 [Pelagophyceae sp. CCMP2097]|nr:hypothetical protein M885DRAFT_173013 [Pelagophyceae sp. CCMP2097]